MFDAGSSGSVTERHCSSSVRPSHSAQLLRQVRILDVIIIVIFNNISSQSRRATGLQHQQVPFVVTTVGCHGTHGRLE